MKKEMTITNVCAPVEPTLSRKNRVVLVNFLRLNKCLRSIVVFYSSLAGQRLTVGETLRIFHVQVAALFLLLPACPSLLMSSVCLLWVILALWQCRKIGKNRD